MMQKLGLINLQFAEQYREALLPTGMLDKDVQPTVVAKLGKEWSIANAKVAEAGISDFVARMEGVDLKSVLENLEVLEVAGLLQHTADLKNADSEEHHEVWSQDDLRDLFVKVKQCGGLTVFLWGLRGIDFKNFRQDFMAMGILRDRIIEAANEAEWAWKLLKSGDQLEKLFSTVGECGGVDDFLEAFEGLNLSTFTTMMGMLKSLDFGDSGGGADQMTQWRALLKKIDAIGGIPGFMRAFGDVSMIDVRLVFLSIWPHGPWDQEKLGRLSKLWMDVDN